jgi:hypothetical protein
MPDPIPDPMVDSALNGSVDATVVLQTLPEPPPLVAEWKAAEPAEPAEEGGDDLLPEPVVDEGPPSDAVDEALLADLSPDRPVGESPTLPGVQLTQVVRPLDAGADESVSAGGGAAPGRLLARFLELSERDHYAFISIPEDADSEQVRDGCVRVEKELLALRDRVWPPQRRRWSRCSGDSSGRGARSTTSKLARPMTPGAATTAESLAAWPRVWRRRAWTSSGRTASGGRRSWSIALESWPNRHHIADPNDDEFSVRNLTEMASAPKDAMNTFSLLLAAVAIVSLVVGIRIMNIMLVSVTERTREIGIRMAVGAKPSHVMAQFLVEAMTLSTSGGLMGLGGGFLASVPLAPKLRWDFVVRPDIVAVSFLFSAVVGAVFGLCPAWKASNLDPIEAPRCE